MCAARSLASSVTRAVGSLRPASSFLKIASTLRCCRSRRGVAFIIAVEATHMPVGPLLVDHRRDGDEETFELHSRALLEVATRGGPPSAHVLGMKPQSCG